MGRWNKRRWSIVLLVAAVAVVGGVLQRREFKQEPAVPVYSDEGVIQWVDFSLPPNALRAALDYTCDSREEEGVPIDFVDLLAVLGTRYGGNWNLYQSRDMAEAAEQLRTGTTAAELMEGYRYYDYYQESYRAVLGGFVGEHIREVADPLHDGEMLTVQRYGLKVANPIGGGFGYSDYDDFGSARSYGFRRNHLGHDLFGTVGTPICAVETGVVQDMCWNQYGGWTIGIRSLDGKRYWYYAHLRKDAPYHIDLEQGRMVRAGQVIGYLGMTGYSAQENVSNMNRPHLHLGLQLIFSPEQEEGEKEIWVDLYGIIRMLESARSPVVRGDDGQYYERYHIYDPVADNFAVPPSP